MTVRLNARPVDLARARLLTGRRPRGSQPGREDGSLILDILIGMAIFALVAIIAVSAVGQYRVRAYTQAAVSDATSVANAVHAYVTDHAADETATFDEDLPSGRLNDSDLELLDVTATSAGGERTVIAITPSPVSVEDFVVCAQHRSGYALYDTAEGGIVESGAVDADGFAGCAPGGGGGQVDEPTTPQACADLGRRWRDAVAASSETADAILPSAYYSAGTWSMPWEIGETREGYETTVSEGRPYPTPDVSADWWPQTAAEQARFDKVLVNGDFYLTRDGDVVTSTFSYPARDAYCEMAA